MVKSNCHTHTTYCDGKNTAEEMILEAIDRGFVSLGFSGHSPMKLHNEWTMSEQSLPLYIEELKALKEKYRNEIDVVTGIELDSRYSDIDLSLFDYTIASVHQIHSSGKYYDVDLSADELTECVDLVFDSDWNKMAEHYFNLVADFALRGDFDVVGHFDLITKFNGQTPLFDENHKDYQAAAIKAIDRILEEKPGMIFEVNTGAMFRRGAKKPYPADFILRAIQSRGGQITITSDCHKKEGIDFAFDVARDLCLACGFSESLIITSCGWKKINL